MTLPQKEEQINKCFFDEKIHWRGKSADWIKTKHTFDHV